MNDLCAGCGKPPHAGGCKLLTTKPPPPTDEELQARLAYLKSDEWKRERGASLAGMNPNPAIDWKARAEKAEAELEAAAATFEDEQAAHQETLEMLAAARLECEGLTAKLNTPELHEFAKGVVLEAAHQRERWGTDQDGGKTPADWFWLVGYLAGKALHAHAEHNAMKTLHHTVTAAAALANWHAAVLGKTNMRPGIEPPAAPQVGEEPTK